MAGRRNKKNGGNTPLKPTERDLRLGEAIAQRLVPAFSEALAPMFAEVNQGLANVTEELRQLREGSAGIGRVTRLELRVDELEKKLR